MDEFCFADYIRHRYVLCSTSISLPFPFWYAIDILYFIMAVSCPNGLLSSCKPLVFIFRRGIWLYFVIFATFLYISLFGVNGILSRNDESSIFRVYSTVKEHKQNIIHPGDCHIGNLHQTPLQNQEHSPHEPGGVGTLRDVRYVAG